MICLLGYHHIHFFHSSHTSFLFWMWLLYLIDWKSWRRGSTLEQMVEGIQTDSDYFVITIILNGTISVIMNQVSKFRRQNKICVVLKWEEILIYNILCTYYCTPSPFAHFWCFTWFFSLYPRNYDIMTYNKLITYAFFIFLYSPLPLHPQKNVCSYDTAKC